MDDLQTTSSNSCKRHWVWIILIAATLVAFWPVFSTPYARVDDPSMILMNPRYLQPSLATFIKHFTDPEWDIFAPLTYGLWQIIAVIVHDPAANGIDRIPPFAFKVVSVLTHVLSALACFRLIEQLKIKRFAAVLGALVFAVHPMQVEAVAWTTGLKDELCGLFSLLAIGFYIEFLRTQRARSWQLTFMCVSAAILSKPTGIILPVTLFAVDYVLVRRPFEKRIVDAIYFIIPAAISIAVMIHIQRPNNIQSPLWSRPLVMLDSYAFYLYKIILPINLVPDYARAPDDVLLHGYFWWTWIIPVVVIMAIHRSKNDDLRLAAILFFCPIFLVSGIKSFDMQQYTTVTDHYAYQSIAAFGLLAAVVIDRLDRMKYVVGGLVVVMAIMTYQQAGRWKDPTQLLVWNAEKYPQAVMPRSVLAIDYLNAGNVVEGERYVRQAVELRQRAMDCAMLGDALYSLNRPDEADRMAIMALNKGLIDKACLSHLTQSARRAKRLDVALEVARRWVEAEPRNFRAIKMMDEIAVEINRSATRPATTQAVQ